MPTTQGYGSTIKYADNEAGLAAGTALAQVLDITAGSVKVAADDVSHMASPDQAKEKEPGWKETGPSTFDLFYTKEQQADLRGLLGVTKWFVVTTPDGATETFAGFVSDLGREIPLQGRIKSKAEITITGLPTFATGA